MAPHIDFGSDNLSAVLHSIKDLRLEQTPFPAAPESNEVILESQTVGICGSDVHFWQEGRIGPFVLKSKIILGHETSAVVKAVGPDVTNFKPGDRVAVEPQIPCRICVHCKRGRYNMCPDTKFLATPPYNGSLTRYFKHAADFCFKLPDDVTFEEASLVEPLAVAVHACNRSGLKVASRVLVTGAGPIGLSCLLVAKAYGASKVCVVDINENRLQMAKSLGADHVFCTKTSGTDMESVANMISALMGSPPNFSFECSGSEAGSQLAFHATELGGTVQLLGMGPHEGVKTPLTIAICKELDIRTSLRYGNCYDTALALIADNRINREKLATLITHRFKLEDALEAFDVVKRGAGIKVMIECGRNQE